jgi:beta-phosphoglucomutase-like phosphatase (HAD superfamily)
MSPPFAHVIFDWSGTLYDDQTPSFLATRQTIIDLGGRRISRADYNREFSLPALGFYRRHGVAEPTAAIDRHYFAAYERVIDQGTLFQGVREALESLRRQRIPTSLFSTRPAMRAGFAASWERSTAPCPTRCGACPIT